MKLEGSPAPSSSSNHVVLERLNNGKADRHKLDSAELPRIREEDIHNVIESLGYINEMHQQERQGSDSGSGKHWMMSGENGSGQFPSHSQMIAQRTHTFTTGQSYNSPGPPGNNIALSLTTLSMVVLVLPHIITLQVTCSATPIPTLREPEEATSLPSRHCSVTTCPVHHKTIPTLLTILQEASLHTRPPSRDPAPRRKDPSSPQMEFPASGSLEREPPLICGSFY